MQRRSPSWDQVSGTTPRRGRCSPNIAKAVEDADCIGEERDSERRRSRPAPLPISGSHQRGAATHRGLGGPMANAWTTSPETGKKLRRRDRDSHTRLTECEVGGASSPPPNSAAFERTEWGRAETLHPFIVTSIETGSAEHIRASTQPTSGMLGGLELAEVLALPRRLFDNRRMYSSRGMHVRHRRCLDVTLGNDGRGAVEGRLDAEEPDGDFAVSRARGPETPEVQAGTQADTCFRLTR